MAVPLVVGVGLGQAYLEGLLSLEAVAAHPFDHMWRLLLAVTGRPLGEKVAERAGGQSLLETARLFRPLLAAGRALKKDGDRLEAVLFNERNRLGEQTVAILAAIRPTDRPSQAKDKGRLIAA
ncbi:hypothetical protein ACWGK6_47480 [Streptomyces violaceusniger]